MKHRKPPIDPKPLTAQPVGEPFFVNETGKSHLQYQVNGRRERVSDNNLSGGYGCYRKMPTCRE